MDLLFCQDEAEEWALPLVRLIGWVPNSGRTSKVLLSRWGYQLSVDDGQSHWL